MLKFNIQLVKTFKKLKNVNEFAFMRHYVLMGRTRPRKRKALTGRLSPKPKLISNEYVIMISVFSSVLMFSFAQNLHRKHSKALSCWTDGQTGS